MTMTLPAETITPLTLDDRKARIVAHVEQAAIHVGEELIAAKGEHPGQFMAWVEAELPFGIDKAERLMSITKAFKGATDEVLGALPPAYSALFELSRMPTDRLNEAIANGDITPASTVRHCRDTANGVAPSEDPPEVELPDVRAKPTISAEVIAAELLRFPANELSDETKVAVRRWVG